MDNYFCNACHNIFEYYSLNNLNPDPKAFVHLAAWVKYTAIQDPETLAALALYGDYIPGLNSRDIATIRERFYPEEPEVYY